MSILFPRPSLCWRKVHYEQDYRRCCGMDVHQETVVVCVLPPDGEQGKSIQKVYGTFRNDLARMRGWLKLLKVTCSGWSNIVNEGQG